MSTINTVLRSLNLPKSLVTYVPHLIIMDEPTNHLDLPSIECLEDALFDCPCGMLLVSHDQRFLDTLTHKQWHISEDRKLKGTFNLEVKL